MKRISLPPPPQRHREPSPGLPFGHQMAAGLLRVVVREPAVRRLGAVVGCRPEAVSTASAPQRTRRYRHHPPASSPRRRRPWRSTPAPQGRLRRARPLTRAPGRARQAPGQPVRARRHRHRATRRPRTGQAFAARHHRGAQPGSSLRAPDDRWAAPGRRPGAVSSSAGGGGGGTRFQGAKALGTVERPRLRRPSTQPLGAVGQLPADVLSPERWILPPMPGFEGAILSADVVGVLWYASGVCHGRCTLVYSPRVFGHTVRTGHSLPLQPAEMWRDVFVRSVRCVP